MTGVDHRSEATYMAKVRPAPLPLSVLTSTAQLAEQVRLPCLL